MHPGLITGFFAAVIEQHSREANLGEQWPTDRPPAARERSDKSWSTDLSGSGDEVGFGFTFGEAVDLAEVVGVGLDEDLGADVEQDCARRHRDHTQGVDITRKASGVPPTASSRTTRAEGGRLTQGEAQETSWSFPTWRLSETRVHRGGWIRSTTPTLVAFRSSSRDVSREPALRSWLILAGHLREQRVDIRPERLPRLAFGLGELGQFLLVADAGEIGVLLPVSQGLCDEFLVAGLDDHGDLASRPIARP